MFCKENISNESKIEWIKAKVVEITNAVAKPSGCLMIALIVLL